MALVANNCSHLDDNVQVTEPLMTLTEIVREGVKNSKLKQGLFPALGEILYMVALQEKKQGRTSDSWTVPSMTYTVISKYCRDSEDAVVNHIAAKIVENVTTIQGPHAQKFLSNELAQSLWYLFKHSTMDALRCTALSALCHLTWLSPPVFQSVVDTVGLTTVLGALSLGISRVQQTIVTMFGMLVQAGGHLTRLVQDKDFLQKIMRLLESPSMVIRGKAFCVLHDVFSASLDMLIPCQARLVMYIERDSRRQTPREGREAEENAEYLAQCLEYLVSFICQSVPVIYRDILSALESAAGRKHPSAVQVRQLKSSLPLLAILPHLVTSQVFRSRVVTEEFVRDLGVLLSHVGHVEAGNTNIESVAEKIKASISVGEFVSLVTSILEGVSQHPSLLLKFHGTILSSVLPTLGSLLASQNVETKASALRLFSEIASVYLSQDQYNVSERQVNIAQLHNIITTNLLPQYEQILLEQEPLPSSGLKLLLALLDQNPVFIRQVEELCLVPVIFQALLDHQNKPLSSAMQSIVGIINCLVCHRETKIKDLYDQGLVDYLSTLFFEVSSVCLMGEEGGRDIKTANAMLQSLLDALHSMLKYLSEVVRKALQAKKAGGDAHSREAEEAETLLMLNKSLTDLTSLLTQLLCYDDSDIHDLATKCLSLLVQLFGGENREAMSQENMGYYGKALQRPDPKRQKVLLRIIKRLVSTDRHHCEAMRDGGDELAQIIKNLVQTASSHADVPLSSLAAEILKATGHLKGK